MTARLIRGHDLGEPNLKWATHAALEGLTPWFAGAEELRHNSSELNFALN